MICIILCAVLAVDDPTAAASPSAADLQFFESRVRPVLVENCLACHGPDKQWAGLRLDSRDAVLKGGESGTAVVPGDAANSLLIRAVRHADDAPHMPQDGQLDQRAIDDLVRWVEIGAPYPAQAAAESTRDRDHWSFQPVTPVQPPSVIDLAWPQTDVDRFILARLEAAGLRPAEPADKTTLIRRVTFDLTGLPPTPDEIASFLADDRPDAYARLIDRLLNAPAYGERWGRHWLDVVRYADSNGLDENIAHGNAWRYRDYVVQSFNADKPFDHFITEQIAGDLLPADSEAQRHEQLIATGLLSIGPKVLAEVNQPKMKMDIVDEQIDTFGRVFLALTLGCARCHDHKFDPVDAVDYYGLAGIFVSTRTMDTYTKVARWHENLLPSPAATALQAEYDQQLAARKQAVEAFREQAVAQAKSQLPAGAELPEDLESLLSEEDKTRLQKLRDEAAELEKNPPELPAAMGVVEDQVVNAALHLRGDPGRLGDPVPRHTPPVINGPAPPEFSDSESGRQQLAQWLTDPRHPLTSRVLVNRVWRWHFGSGLVRTTDNFGLQGELPSHPQLLDWLAARFVHDDWSLKRLHRLLLLSSVYQQSSQGDPATVTSDPENRLFGRANIQRLGAEQIRDSLLSVSGQLDQQFGGSLLKVKNRGYLFDHTSIDTTDYSSRRRSLYLPVIRNHVYDVFQLLDFPDPAVPTGSRSTTTVAPQALLMMNSDLVMQAADGLAERLLAESPDDEARLELLHLIAYGRSITAEERALHRQFLEESAGMIGSAEPDPAQCRQRAWSTLCHTVLASSEFIYLR